jgi:transcription-repair coupling factor (superfamily II helicase)
MWPTDYATFPKLPPWPSVRVPKTPLQDSKPTRATPQHRILVLAESDGRRESLLDFLRASAGVTRPRSTPWKSFLPATKSLASPPPR